MNLAQLNRLQRTEGQFGNRKGVAAWLAGLLLVYAVACSPRAHAGDSSHDDVTDLSLEDLRKVQVYSASMYLQDDRKAPSSVTVVTADEIRRCGYRTLADMLRNVRGFYVSYDRNYSYVGVRGFNRPGDYNSRILLLLNGHRLTDNVYDQAYFGTDFQLDVDLIERVEIIRGPSSSLYGTNAFFAVINVISKDARTVQGTELAGEVDGFGTYKARATYGEEFRGVGLFLSGTAYDSGGASRLFFPAFDSPSSNHGYALNADHDSSRSFIGRITFGHFTLESVGSTRQKRIPTASFDAEFNDPGTHTIDGRGYVDLKYDRTFQGNTELTARIFFDRVYYHGVYVDDLNNGSEDTLNEDFGRGDWTGGRIKVTKTILQKHKLTGGVDLQDNLKQDQWNFDLYPFAVNLSDYRSSTEWGIFAQDEFSITRQFTLNAGLRHDRYYTFGGTTHPRLALIYSPFPKTSLKLLHGHAFRAPNSYELYYSDGISQEPNPHLRPETIVATELVWEQDLGSGLRLTVDGFENRISGLINQQVDPANGLLFYANTEKARSRGLELELAGRTSKGIEGRVSYSLQSTVDSATGATLSNSPEHLAKAEVIWPFAHRRFFLGSDLQFMSSRTTLTGSSVASYGLANFTLSTREFGGGYQLSASVYNLFNHLYSDPVGSEIQQAALAQNGRDFRIKLTRVFHAR